MFLWRFGCCEVRWGKAQHGLAEEEPGLVWRAQQVAVPVSNRVTETSWSDLFCREWHAKVTELCQNHNSRQVLQVWEHLELVFGVTPDMTMTWLWHDYDMTTWVSRDVPQGDPWSLPQGAVTPRPTRLLAPAAPKNLQNRARFFHSTDSTSDYIYF